MEKEINGIVYEQIATSKGCSDCDLKNNFACHDLDCYRVVWKKKTNEWQELDINNIPSDLFKNWEIEVEDTSESHKLALIYSKWVKSECIYPGGKYRIRPKKSNKISNIRVEVKSNSSTNVVNIYKNGDLCFNTVSKKGNEDIDVMSQVCEDIIKEALYSTENNDAKTLEEKAEEYEKNIIKKIGQFNKAFGFSYYELSEKDLKQAYIAGAKSRE